MKKNLKRIAAIAALAAIVIFFAAFIISAFFADVGIWVIGLWRYWFVSLPFRYWYGCCCFVLDECRTSIPLQNFSQKIRIIQQTNKLYMGLSHYALIVQHIV